MKPGLRRLFETEWVLTRRAHPAAAHQLTHATRTGEAVALLPGTYCLSTVAGHASAKLLAPIRSDPNSVLTLGAAALAGYDFDRACPTTVVAATAQRTSRGRGIRLERRCGRGWPNRGTGRSRSPSGPHTVRCARGT